MLIGLVLGWLLDESFSTALLGALLGLAIGQTLRIARIGTQAAEQQRQLEQAKVALQAVEQRLFLLEGTPVQAAPPSSAAPASEPVVEPARIVEQAPAPELVWELPPELEPISAAAHETNQPLPDDVWRLEAVTTEPQQPAEPRGPNLIERGISAARNWLFGGNTVLRVGVVLLFFGLAFLLRYATEGMVVPIELRYAGVRCRGTGLAGAGLVAAAPQQQLCVDAARHRHRGVVPDSVCGDAPASVAGAVGRAGLAGGGHGVLGDSGDYPGRPGAGVCRRARRFRCTDSDFDRRWQPCRAVQLFRAAQRRHPRHRLVQGLAPAQPDWLRWHLWHRFRLGAAFLCAAAFVEHRAVSDSVLPDVPGHWLVVRPPKTTRHA